MAGCGGINSDYGHLQSKTTFSVADSSSMVDKISPEKRSANMARIRSTDTRPELKVRRTAHALGYRFRLHRKDLPGRPDLVFPGRRSIIFVHGCFWHRHEGCVDCSNPGSRREYWIPKFEATKARDRRAVAELQADGWKVLIVWECETGDPQHLGKTLKGFLGSPSRRGRLSR